MRHRRRALSYMFRQFASASSSLQRLVVITVRDLATTVATGSTAAAATGAVITIAGIEVVAAGVGRGLKRPQRFAYSDSVLIS